MLKSFTNAKETLIRGTQIPQDFTQIEENAPAHTILIHQPSSEVFMSALHPAGSLYQDVTDDQEVLRNFAELRGYLTKQGIRTITIKEALQLNRAKLEIHAFEALTYKTHEDFNPDHSHFVSDDYKNEVIRKLSDDQLLETIITQPTLVLSEGKINTFVRINSIKTKPLGNLIFCRDQQITTKKGIVISNMNALQRKRETEILKSVWENLGAKIIGEVTGNGRLEGGDYFPAKKDLSLLGIGLRTNMEAAHYLLENDLFGHDRVALVVDEVDLSQDRMHLDTIFNIVSENEVVLLDFDTVDQEKDLRRKVQLFIKKDAPGDFGYYHLVNKDIVLYFEDFLKQEGYKIIPITDQEQAEYMINFLNLGNNQIVSVNRGLENKLKAYGSQTNVKYIEFGAVKEMYGAVHCATQVFRTR